jgi:ribonuclease inhibitor
LDVVLSGEERGDHLGLLQITPDHYDAGTTPRMGMNVVIDGLNIRSSDDFYRQLAAALDLPSYGRNVDALWDLLSTGVERPFSIEWKDSDRSREVLREDFDAIVKVLDRVVDYDKDDPVTERFRYSLL